MTGSGNVNGYLQSLIDGEVTPCLSVLMTQRGRAIVEFISGCAPAPEHWPIDRKTRFNIGSVTKPVTGSLIVKLQELGELGLDDPVKRYIPEFLYGDITILHLMTHTAGFDSAVEIPWPKDKSEAREYMRRIYGVDRLLTAPGEAAAYYTPGYSILMDIVERVSRCPLEAFARETLFNPLGMDDTTLDTDRLQEGSFVLPYSEEEHRAYSELRHSPPTGDSGLYTTALDLARFGEMFLGRGMFRGRKVFGESAAGVMLSECTGGRFWKTPVFWLKGPRDLYGCFSPLHSAQCVCHTGFSGCMLFIDPPAEVVGVILSNSMKLHADWGNYGKICTAALKDMYAAQTAR